MEPAKSSPRPAGFSSPHDLPQGERSLRNALIESRLRYKDLVELSTDFAWETDALGRFSFVSPHGALGWRVTDLVNRDTALFLDDPAQRTIFTTRGIVSGQAVSFRQSNGDLACLSVSAKPILDMAGEWSGARGVCRDITELRRREQELAEARLHDNLMTRIVRTMRDELHPALALKAAIAATCLAVGASGGAVIRNASSAAIDPDIPWGEVAPATSLDAIQDRLNDAVSASLTGDELYLIGHAARFRQERQGVIVLWKPEERGTFEDGDLVLLADVADYLGVALAQIASLEHIVTLSRTDPLTALLNRRAFLEELDRRLARLRRDGERRQRGAAPAGALLFIDLDNFKRINDESGHAAGDRALRSVAAALQNGTRSNDLVARFGGDEFVIWIDGISRTAALRRAHLLLEQFTAEPRSGDAASCLIGMSIGIAFNSPVKHQDASELIVRADAAMYRAKQAGKRTIVVAPDIDARTVAGTPA